jgi:hypothetical protein
MRRLLGITLLAALVCAPAAQAHHPPERHPPQVQPIASDLNSPRHLAFDWRGNLYVAEAGTGGAGPCFFGGEGPACMGDSGSVTKISRWGEQTRIVEHLASYANVDPANTNAIGPHGITVIGNQVFVTNGGPTEPKVTQDGPPISRDALAAQNDAANWFGWLLRLRRPGQEPQKIADLWAFERDVNPDAATGNPAVDSNPVDVLFDGRRFVVADAGGNAIDVVRPWGPISSRVSNLAVFPNRPGVPNPFGGPPVDMQAVPTSVVLGPDHQYYVSQLTGFPFPVGGANVYRVNPRTGETSVVASGFTNIMDLAFGPDGTLYVLEIDHDGLLPPSGSDGAIFAISKRGERRQLQLPAGALPMPGGITVGRGGLYVTINSGSPGDGKVVRIGSR